jgi:hypothetical protein
MTMRLNLEDLIDIDNSNRQGHELDKYETLNQASKDINDLVKEARAKKKRMRAIGSAWALSNIQVTDHWLLNTKLLNRCFEMDGDCFHADYPAEKKPYLVIAQCGISIGELNVYLEMPKDRNRERRSLRTSGIGAGQTVVGAVSGNTHGSAVNFGALPDFVVAIQICNGREKPFWIERSSYRVMNEAFVNKVQSTLIADDEIFHSAVVSFGAFGIVTAYAIETEPIYHIQYPKIREVNLQQLGQILTDFSYYSKLRHLEFVFNPYYEDSVYLIEGTQVPFEEGHPEPKPLWILPNKLGYAPGDLTTKFLLLLPFVSGKKKTSILFKEYLKNAVLSEVRGTSGQLFTATITYLEGYNETAFAVSSDQGVRTIRLAQQATRESKLPLVWQARVVHPGQSVFGFTNHDPKAIVFEFGIANTGIYPKFEEKLLGMLRAAGIRYTFHWSKNAMVNPHRLEEMYGAQRIRTWKKSRTILFDNETDLMDIFNNVHLQQAGLDTPLSA